MFAWLEKLIKLNVSEISVQSARQRNSSITFDPVEHLGNSVR